MPTSRTCQVHAYRINLYPSEKAADVGGDRPEHAPTLEISRPSAHLYFPSQPPSISHLSLSRMRWQQTQFRSHNVQCCHLIGWRALLRALRKPAADLSTLADLSKQNAEPCHIAESAHGGSSQRIGFSISRDGR